MWSALRWMLVPVAAALGFCIAVVLSWPMDQVIQPYLSSSGRVTPMAHGALMFATLPYDGALAATLFLQLGTYAAPSHKRQAAVGLLIVGAVVAWCLVGPFSPPWPIIGTYVSGLVTLAFLWVVFRKKGPPHSA
jgi:cbb3-type cytochrome oxidase subunit 1